MTNVLLVLVAVLLISALAAGVYAYRKLTSEPGSEEGPEKPLDALTRGPREEKPEFRFRRSGEDDREVVNGITQALSIDVRVRPLSYGEYRSYDGFGQPVMQWSSADQARLLREHLVEPDLSEELEDGERLDGRTLEEEFEAFEIVDLIQAVVTYSGLHRFFRGNGSGKARDLLRELSGSRSRTPASASNGGSTGSATATSESGASTT